MTAAITFAETPPVYCTALPSVPANMIMNVTSLAINAALTFRCTDGHALVGNATKMCGADGTWDGGTPSCIGKY